MARPRPIMLKILPIMVLSNAQKNLPIMLNIMLMNLRNMLLLTSSKNILTLLLEYIF